MPDSFVGILRDWQNFYMLLGGAAATLTGLMFVAVSLASTRIAVEQADMERTFVTPTLIHFGSVLLGSALMVAPHQMPITLAGLLLLVGVIGLGLSIIVAWRLVFHHERGTINADHWLWHAILPVAGYLLIVGAAIWLFSNPAGAIMGVAGAMIVLMLVGIRNAWDLALWLARHRDTGNGNDFGVDHD